MAARPRQLVYLGNLKWINDAYGHAFGDAVLTKVAVRIRAALRGYGLLGRIGGEEFIIIFSQTSLEEAIRLTERIRQALKSQGIKNSGKESAVTLSAWVAVLKNQDRDIDAMLARADNALYQAKQGVGTRWWHRKKSVWGSALEVKFIMQKEKDGFMRTRARWTLLVITPVILIWGTCVELQHVSAGQKRGY